MWFPYTDASTALRYIDHNKVDFIVLSDISTLGWPYLTAWIKGGIPDPRARLVYSVRDKVLGRIFIYQWHPAVGVPGGGVGRGPRR